ncbi:MAG: hypothetical protein WD800_00105 [Dehalococcoidia bacterium]
MLAIATCFILLGLACDGVGAILALLPDLGPRATEMDRLFAPSSGKGWAQRSRLARWFVVFIAWDEPMVKSQRRMGAWLLVIGFSLQFVGVSVGAFLA